MQILELSEELTRRAVGTLAKKEALAEAMKIFREQVAANHIEAAQLWADVEGEVKAQGIEKAKDEIYTFDHITRRFAIVKPSKG